MTRKICLVAGSGDLPVAVAEAAVRRGTQVSIVSLVARGAVVGVESVQVEPNRIDLILGAIKALAPSHIALAGYAPAETLAALKQYGVAAGVPPHAGGAELAAGIGAVVTKITGARFIGVHEIAPELLVPVGHIAGPGPSDELYALAREAVFRAREFGLRDIGQALVLFADGAVEHEDEAGTDALIARVAEQGRLGGVLGKAAKPQQPLFADLPVIGPTTIVNSARAGISLIAVEAGRTLVVDLPAVRDAASLAGIAIVGIDG